MTRTAGSTANAPAPAGPYSQSVRLGPWVYSSGQSGGTPSGEMAADVETQTSRCIDNVLEAIAALDAREEHIAKLTVYLTDAADFAAMNRVYETKFSRPFPARTTVFVGLAPGLLVEIDAVAYSPNVPTT